MFPDRDALKELSRPAGEISYKTMSGLSLAFIGDAVYEIMIREYILSLADARVQALHRATVRMVNASYQAAAIGLLAPELTEEETAVYKRGRNANSAHTPKNKSEAEYHKATGFEALFGYLYLAGRYDRLRTLFDRIIAAEREKGETDEK